MDNLSELGIGGIAALIVLERVGLLDRFLPKKNGNGKQEQINADLFSHARVANEEAAQIKTDIAVMKTDIAYMRDDVKEVRQDLKTLIAKS